jgi:tRNA (cmo5U34)-methyltransferase
MRRFERRGEWSVVRSGAVAEWDVGAALEGQFHFDPDSYLEMIRRDIEAYDEFQGRVVDAAASSFDRVLELGTGTGETSARLLRGRPDVALVGIDESDAMLAAARTRLAAAGSTVDLRVARLQDPLPDGPFDLVLSALCVHHLDGPEKRDLFARIARVLAPGGRFVLGDVVVPDDPADAVISLTPGYDKPSTIAEQLEWLCAAGFDARLDWVHRDLVILVADLPGPQVPSSAP